MNTEHKQLIARQLQTYVSRYPSQNKAAQSLKGVSAATVSTILASNFQLISDDMFRRIEAQVSSPTDNQGWQIVPTTPFQEITFALDDAQQFRSVTWVVAQAGAGKTTTARLYASQHREVFYILCSEDMHRAEFIREIARLVGLRTDGLTLHELWKAILHSLVQMQAPLIIFDEADKLTEGVFHYFISLYNKVEDHCGIVFLSTDYIIHRINRGLRCKKPGYQEFYSRIGRKYFQPEETSPADVLAICRANGLSQSADIDQVMRDAEASDFDLRRVRKAIHRIHRTRT